MADEKNKPLELHTVSFVARLVKQTGITEVQARDLISILGSDWASLIREARLLKKR